MSQSLARLRNRRQFLRVAETGRKSVMPDLILQVRPHDDADCDCAEPVRLGLTVSRRVGNAVERNRARRRLRAAAEDILPVRAARHVDYVLIGRRQTLDAPFPSLTRHLVEALQKLGADGAAIGPGGAQG